MILGYTQDGLSKRSGVSLGSIKRFESTGKISLDSLLKLSVILEYLNQFATICTTNKQNINSMEELITQKEIKIPKKGKIK